jgi:hypothetical protein
MSDHYDPDAWEGNTEKLRGFEDLLEQDADACAATFASEHEAFSSGLWLGAAGLDRLPWGDLDYAISDLEACIERMCVVTDGHFEHRDEPDLDELAIPLEQVVAISDDAERLDYLGRLAYMTRLVYGTLDNRGALAHLLHRASDVHGGRQAARNRHRLEHQGS